MPKFVRKVKVQMERKAVRFFWGGQDKGSFGSRGEGVGTRIGESEEEEWIVTVPEVA